MVLLLVIAASGSTSSLALPRLQAARPTASSMWWVLAYCAGQNEQDSLRVAVAALPSCMCRAACAHNKRPPPASSQITDGSARSFWQVLEEAIVTCGFAPLAPKYAPFQASPSQAGRHAGTHKICGRLSCGQTTLLPLPAIRFHLPCWLLYPIAYLGAGALQTPSGAGGLALSWCTRARSSLESAE